MAAPGNLSRRCFSSSPNVNERTFQYGSNGRGRGRIRFSKLSPRQSAELEDELLSRINVSKDERLLDPILGKSISRSGLDWFRTVSVPSSFGFGGDDVIDDDRGDSVDSITVSIRPPTLLHPKLTDLASNVARFVQEVTLSLIGDSRRSAWFAATNFQPDSVGVTVRISPGEPRSASSSSNREIGNQGRALENVAHFLAVYSCKGGVGKSTIAANLAYRLASLGGRVGLVDLDVYGPSLPVLVRPDDPAVRQSPPELGAGMVEPITHGGVRLMSLGYVSPDSGVPGAGQGGGAAVLRGPMAGRVVSQLLKGTNWGALDVLVLDLPPGTGDVQLEVCQSLSLSGAVAVSTPSELSWADARKGVRMFDEMGVRTLALVENMAYFVCEGGGRHYPFGRARAASSGGGDRSSTASAEPLLPDPSRVFHLPISSALNASNEAGAPLCSAGPAGGAEEELAAFAGLADAVSEDLLLMQHGVSPSSSGDGDDGSNVLTVAVDAAGDAEFDVPFTRLSVDNGSRNLTVRLFSGVQGYETVISGDDLRRRDPKTGEEGEGSDAPPRRGGCGGGGGPNTSALSSMVQRHTGGEGADVKRDRLFPAKIAKKGNYGYEVEWADGATIIYSLLAIARAAGGKPPIEDR